MKKILLLISCVFIFSVPGWADCTKEEMERKAREVALRLEALQQKNEDEYKAILLNLNNRSRLIDKHDIQAVCDFYSQALWELPTK